MLIKLKINNNMEETYFKAIKAIIITKFRIVDNTIDFIDKFPEVRFELEIVDWEGNSSYKSFKTFEEAQMYVQKCCTFETAKVVERFD